MGKSPSIKVTTMPNSVAKNIVVVDIVLVGHVISQDYLSHLTFLANDIVQVVISFT